MYEAHFGLSGPPFQLNPDPAFYFDSRGHSNALAYLRYGVYQGEGFIVVTGEIGAGKTTLVRTLLEGLDQEKVVAAQVVSTQLESGDLLRAISNAFGIPLSGQTKAHVLASLEGFLNALVVTGRRALLVVDEAQNLDAEAIEELRMLSNFHVGNRALLQSFLVGQPELRTLMESASMEQLRQRVIASCHLGPLGFEETRSYVEHRLHHVGWDDRPHFDPRAFAAIHTATDGIPRRINLLCNRLLLAAFLGNKPNVDTEMVERVAAELRGETGVSKFVPPTEERVDEQTQAARGTYRIDDEGVTRQMHAHSVSTAAPIMVMADTAGGLLMAAALARHLASDPRLPPIVIVNPFGQGLLEAESDAKLLLDTPAVVVHLGVAGGAVADRSAAVTLRTAALLDEFKPAAFVCIGNGDPVVDAALLACRRGLRVVRLHAGIRPFAATSSGKNMALLSRLADVHYTSGLSAQSTLHREGIDADSVVCVGNPTYLLLDTLSAALPDVQSILAAAVRPHGLGVRGHRGYVLVTEQLDDVDGRFEDAQRLVAVLQQLRNSADLVWPVTDATLSALQSQQLIDELTGGGVTLLQHCSFLQEVALLKAAKGVVSGPGARLADEASCLGIRTAAIVEALAGAVRVGESRVKLVDAEEPSAVAAIVSWLSTGDSSADARPHWDRDVGRRIAAHLGPWLAGRATESAQASSRRATP
jgi:general secretion pathway protein A